MEFEEGIQISNYIMMSQNECESDYSGWPPVKRAWTVITGERLPFPQSFLE